VQTIPWGQPVDEAGVLPDLCGGGALHESEVYLTRVSTLSGCTLEGFLVIEKKKNDPTHGYLNCFDLLFKLILNG
jgi:hypothetical protein